MRIIDVRESLPRHRWKRYSRRRLIDVSHVVIHHSGTRSGTPEAFARFHVDIYGWPGIGYHYVIRKDGTIFKTNALTDISYHARNLNGVSVGICLIGNFNHETPVSAQLSALKELVEVLRKYLTVKEVIFHRDVEGSRTVCPGKLFPLNWDVVRGTTGQDEAVQDG